MEWCSRSFNRYFNLTLLGKKIFGPYALYFNRTGFRHRHLPCSGGGVDLGLREPPVLPRASGSSLDRLWHRTGPPRASFRTSFPAGARLRSSALPTEGKLLRLPEKPSPPCLGSGTQPAPLLPGSRHLARRAGQLSGVGGIRPLCRRRTLAWGCRPRRPD